MVDCSYTLSKSCDTCITYTSEDIFYFIFYLGGILNNVYDLSRKQLLFYNYFTEEVWLLLKEYDNSLMYFRLIHGTTLVNVQILYKSDQSLSDIFLRHCWDTVVLIRLKVENMRSDYDVATELLNTVWLSCVGLNKNS